MKLSKSPHPASGHLPPGGGGILMTDVVAVGKILVEGQEWTELPTDLFIPPDALEVLLDSFTGPLDLLLYLIRKQNIDIMNIPIESIARQYLKYIQLMH